MLLQAAGVRPGPRDPDPARAHLGGHVGGSTSRSSPTTSRSAPVRTSSEEWKHGQTVSVNRNDACWGTPPRPGHGPVVLYRNEDIMAQSLKPGEVDILPEMPPTIYDGLDGPATLKPVVPAGVLVPPHRMNVSTSPDSKGNPLLLQKEVRQALGYAIDRNQLVQIALAGHGKPGAGLLPPALGTSSCSSPRTSRSTTTRRRPTSCSTGRLHDRDATGCARPPTAQPLEFRLIAIESTTVDVRAAQLFRDACAKVGIKMDLQTMDENTLGNTVYNTEGPTGTSSCGAGTRGSNDPDYLLGVPLTSRSAGTTTSTTRTRSTTTCTRSRPPSSTCRRERTSSTRRSSSSTTTAAYIVMWYQDKLQAYREDLWTGLGRHARRHRLQLHARQLPERRRRS